MVSGTQLATTQPVEAGPLPPDRKPGRTAWRKVGFLIGIIALLRATIETQAPVGYEDEAGFHYGLDATGWFFSI